MEFLTHTLPNGLEIVAECNAAAYSTALGFFVRTGARDETDAVAGVSHFLEHMVFKGTPSRSADDVNREFDEMGAHYNAFTNEENTVFYAAVLPEHQDRAGRAAGRHPPPVAARGRFRHREAGDPRRDPDVRGPAAVRGRRQVPGAALRLAPAGPQRAGHRREHRRPAGRGDARLFPPALQPGQHRAGRRRPDRLRRPGGAGRAALRRLGAGRGRSNDRAGRGRRRISGAAQGNRHAAVPAAGCRRPAAEDDDRYAAKLLATVLGDDSGSRLYWELVDPGLAEHASLSHGEHQGAGMMMTYMSCDPEHAADNLQRILNVYRRAEAEGVTAAELEQAKSKIRSRIVLSSERPRGRLFAVGSDWVYRREYRPTAARLGGRLGDHGRRARTPCWRNIR